jgi:hypothetical protein
MDHASLRAWLAVCLGFAGGCTGVVEEEAGSASSPPDATAPAPMPPPAIMGAGLAGPMPLRRLTRDEYNYTVEDLLGDTRRPALSFPEDNRGASGFATAGAVGALELRRLMETGEDVAANAVENLGKLLPCDPGAGEDRCAAQFIESFGRRAFRRRLGAADTMPLVAIYTQARKEWSYDFKNAIRVVLQAMLQSSSFLYRWELGPTAAPIKETLAEGVLLRLDGDEVAARLSYMLWSSMPDDPLFRAADAGQLGTLAGVEREARRMLRDGKARRALTAFHTQWLNLDHLEDLQKDTGAFPEFTPALRKAMADELPELVTGVFQGDGKLDTLLTAPVGYVSGPLAAFYGTTPAPGSKPERRDLDPGQRAGILTSAGFLAKQGNTYESHPVKRGKLVYEQVLCGSVPAPPPNVPPLGKAAAGSTTRERYQQHATDPTCAACHKIFDGVGFAFESYDGIGKYRTTDAGKPVDASGTVTLPATGATKSFRNAIELVKAVAASEDARRCVTRQWADYGLGRQEIDAEKPSLDGAYTAFAGSGFDLRELLVALTRSRAFLYRQPAAGEVLP